MQQARNMISIATHAVIIIYPHAEDLHETANI